MERMPYLLSTYRTGDAVVIQCESEERAEAALSRVMDWLRSQTETGCDALVRKYQRAIWFLQDIANMSKKVGSETAAHALAQLGEPRTVEPELRHDSPEIQFADVLKELDRGAPVNTQDAINALQWTRRNQKREIARLHEKRAAETSVPHQCVAVEQIAAIEKKLGVPENHPTIGYALDVLLEPADETSRESLKPELLVLLMDWILNEEGWKPEHPDGFWNGKFEKLARAAQAEWDAIEKGAAETGDKRCCVLCKEGTTNQTYPVCKACLHQKESVPRAHPDPSPTETEADHWLGELLALIHRDGGHYQSEHGTEKAAKDAIEKLGALKARVDG